MKKAELKAKRLEAKEARMAALKEKKAALDREKARQESWRQSELARIAQLRVDQWRAQVSTLFELLSLDAKTLDAVDLGPLLRSPALRAKLAPPPGYLRLNASFGGSAGGLVSGGLVSGGASLASASASASWSASLITKGTPSTDAAPNNALITAGFDSTFDTSWMENPLGANSGALDTDFTELGSRPFVGLKLNAFASASELDALFYAASGGDSTPPPPPQNHIRRTKHSKN